MLGWENKIVRRKKIYHLRAMSTAERGILAAHFPTAKRIIISAGSPLWEIFRVGYRAMKNHFLSAHRRFCSVIAMRFYAEQNVPYRQEFDAVFTRRNQMRKLKKIFRSLMRFKKWTNFRLETSRPNFLDPLLSGGAAERRQFQNPKARLLPKAATTIPKNQ